MTCETAYAKAASQASHSFINENGLLVNVFDPTLQLFHDLWTFCLPIAMATIFKHLFAYCFVLVERRCQRNGNQGFKRVPHTLDHSDITFEKGMPTKMNCEKKTYVLIEFVNRKKSLSIEGVDIICEKHMIA